MSPTTRTSTNIDSRNTRPTRGRGRGRRTAQDVLINQDHNLRNDDLIVRLDNLLDNFNQHLRNYTEERQNVNNTLNNVNLRLNQFENNTDDTDSEQLANTQDSTQNITQNLVQDSTQNTTQNTTLNSTQNSIQNSIHNAILDRSQSNANTSNSQIVNSNPYIQNQMHLLNFKFEHEKLNHGNYDSWSKYIKMIIRQFSGEALLTEQNYDHRLEILNNKLYPSIYCNIDNNVKSFIILKKDTVYEIWKLLESKFTPFKLIKNFKAVSDIVENKFKDGEDIIKFTASFVKGINVLNKEKEVVSEYLANLLFIKAFSKNENNQSYLLKFLEENEKSNKELKLNDLVNSINLHLTTRNKGNDNDKPFLINRIYKNKWFKRNDRYARNRRRPPDNTDSNSGYTSNSKEVNNKDSSSANKDTNYHNSNKNTPFKKPYNKQGYYNKNYNNNKKDNHNKKDNQTRSSMLQSAANSRPTISAIDNNYMQTDQQNSNENQLDQVNQTFNLRAIILGSLMMINFIQAVYDWIIDSGAHICATNNIDILFNVRETNVQIKGFNGSFIFI